MFRDCTLCDFYRNNFGDVMNPLLIERAKAYFTYEPETGELLFRIRPRSDFANLNAFSRNVGREGKPAGFPFNGYIGVKIDGKLYKAHRICWLMTFGLLKTDYEIDHINGVRSDNRLENLREVTRSENLRNRGIAINNKSGVPGVYWHKHSKKWHSTIYVEKQRFHLGSFISIEDAQKTRVEAEAKFGFLGGTRKSYTFERTLEVKP